MLGAVLPRVHVRFHALPCVPQRSSLPDRRVPARPRAFPRVAARSRARSAHIAGLALLLLSSVPAAAQETGSRAAEVAREQAEKATRLEPSRPLWIERKLLEIEQA